MKNLSFCVLRPPHSPIIRSPLLYTALQLNFAHSNTLPMHLLQEPRQSQQWLLWLLPGQHLHPLQQHGRDILVQVASRGRASGRDLIHGQWCRRGLFRRVSDGRGSHGGGEAGLWGGDLRWGLWLGLGLGLGSLYGGGGGGGS